MTRSPSIRLYLLCAGLPAIAGLFFLLVVSRFVFGHAFRPGLYAEALLVLYASVLLMQFQRRKPRAALFNTLLLLAFYATYLVKFLVLGEGISASDLAGLDELFSVLSMWQRVLVLGVIGTLGALLASNLTFPRPVSTVLLLAPIAIYFVGCSVAPGAVVALFESVRPTSAIVELQPWRDGPLIVAARQLPRVRATQQFLRTPPEAVYEDADLQRRARALADLPPARRNVYILFLESFIDPLSFRVQPCSSDPIDARFRRWITEGETLALAATFGGQSARTEFEVFCGVPSFERLGVDMMALNGASIPCLPNLLRSFGYATIASSSATPSFFNHDTAYAAVGFERRYLSPAFVMTEANMDGEHLSDDALYEQTKQWVLPAMREERPLLSFVTTFFGHAPFDLHPQRHPPVCPDDTLAGKVANTAHYKSVALADYVEWIESHDPEALIAVVADHLPPLGFAHSGYRAADYRLRFRGRDVPPFWAADEPSWLESRATTLVVRKARRPVSLGIIPHYLLPDTLLDLLTEGAYCRATTCFRTLPILNRPHGTRPVFTTPGAFPLPVCAGSADAGDDRCGSGEAMQHVLEAEYDALLRAGVREPSP